MHFAVGTVFANKIFAVICCTYLGCLDCVRHDFKLMNYKITRAVGVREAYSAPSCRRRARWQSL